MGFKMGDLRSKKLILIKGVLFFLLALMASVYSLCEFPLWIRILALMTGLWAFARFYYFLFYVLEKYVDPTLKYTGIYDLIVNLLRKK